MRPISSLISLFVLILYHLEIAKKVVKARKADRSGGSRAETEAAERKRFALELSVLIKKACLPVVYQIEQLDNQNIAWERIFGSRRSKTLRNRFRSWNKYRMWLAQKVVLLRQAVSHRSLLCLYTN